MSTFDLTGTGHVTVQLTSLLQRPPASDDTLPVSLEPLLLVR